jgi:hypothetical protein
MSLNPATVLNPVFNFLDALISNYGVYLYLVFVWLSLGAIAWVLSGGLRRKRSQGNSTTVIPAIIFTMQPPMQSPASSLNRHGTTTTKQRTNHDNFLLTTIRPWPTCSENGKRRHV